MVVGMNVVSRSPDLAVAGKEDRGFPPRGQDLTGLKSPIWGGESTQLSPGKPNSSLTKGRQLLFADSEQNIRLISPRPTSDHGNTNT